ncbi:MAG: phosphate butyryltransferase [Prevotella sp.]|nr:phosphate butyryltransferase [Prevotella sp.]
MAKAISNFHELIASLSTRNERKRVAVVWPEDESTQYSVGLALDYGLIDVICVGCERQVRSNEHLAPYAEHFSFVDAADRDEAARLSVQLVREGKADILMKGLINTDNLLRAVLDRQTGILPEGRVLTHVTAATIPSYPKMLFFTDSAVIPYPTNAQRRQQVMYVADVCRSFGIAEPRISLIHCTEKVSQKHFPFTVHYRELAEAAQRGEFGPCIVDGPLDLKTSVSIESMRTKGIQSPINGEADALVFPDIEAANVFYKTITLFCDVETAGMLQGAMAPVVLPSRSDSKLCKFYSLALAIISC